MTFSSKYLIHISFIFFLNVVLVASEAARPLPPGLYLKPDLYSLYCGHQTFSTSVMFFFPPYYNQIHQTASFLFPPSSHKGLVYFYNSILLLRLHLTTSCHVRYVSDVAILPIPMYDTHLRATHTTTSSTRGVQIPIYLVSSTTDSLW